MKRKTITTWKISATQIKETHKINCKRVFIMAQPVMKDPHKGNNLPQKGVQKTLLLKDKSRNAQRRTLRKGPKRRIKIWPITKVSNPQMIFLCLLLVCR